LALMSQRTDSPALELPRPRLNDPEADARRWREHFEAAPEPYLVTDAAGLILEANRAAGQFFHAAPAALLGLPVWQFVAPESQAAFRAFWGRLGQTTARHEGLFSLTRPGAEPCDVALSAAAVRDREGRWVGARCLLRDVSAVRRAERRAGMADVILGLAHSVRNLLQRGQAHLERLSWRAQDQPPLRDLVARLQGAQDALVGLFERARSCALVPVPERRPCDLAAVWQEAWAEARAHHAGRDAVLEEGGETDRHCEADARLLRLAFRQIFDNALEACPEPVRVTVTADAAVLDDRPALRVAVRDNGPGLTAEQAGRLFEPFYTTRPQAAGLGMAIVKLIVESHGGRVEVGPGPGTQIVVLLPRR
jgi:PAS domain S-box-containing protein